MTGVLLTVEDLRSKQLALAAEMVPNARKVGLLVNPGNPTHEVQRLNMEAAAAALGIELVALQARMPDDLHAAFDKLTRERLRWCSRFQMECSSMSASGLRYWRWLTGCHPCLVCGRMSKTAD